MSSKPSQAPGDADALAPAAPEDDEFAQPQFKPKYPSGHICCIFTSKHLLPAFKVVKIETCVKSGVAFQWPSWEALYGCIPPPRVPSKPGHPVCCFTRSNGIITFVEETTLSNCQRHDSQVTQIPVPWTKQTRCITGNPADYPQLYQRQQFEVARDSTLLFMYTGVAVLIFVILTCCYFTFSVMLRNWVRAHRARGPFSSPPPASHPDVSFSTVSSSAAARVWLASSRGAAVAAEDPNAQQNPPVYVVMPDKSVFIGEVSEGEATHSSNSLKGHAAVELTDMADVVAARNAGRYTAAGDEGSPVVNPQVLDVDAQGNGRHGDAGAQASGWGNDERENDLASLGITDEAVDSRESNRLLEGQDGTAISATQTETIEALPLGSGVRSDTDMMVGGHVQER